MPPRIIAFAMMLALTGGNGAASAPPATSAEYQAAFDAAFVARADSFEARFAEAVALRQREEGLDEIRTKIAVSRDLAARHAAQNAWANAISHLLPATHLAQLLGDPELLLAVLMERARYQREANDPRLTLETLRRAGDIIAALDRPEMAIEHSFLRIELLYAIQIASEAEAAYETLARTPGVDPLRLAHHHARHTKPDRTGVLFIARWSRVLDLARQAGRREIQAEAHDRLGEIAVSLKRYAESAGHFAAAEALGVPLDRSSSVWQQVVEANTRLDNRDVARAAIQKGFALVDAAKDPGRAVPLHEARGELLARDGDFAGAYADLHTANELRVRHNAARQSFPLVRMAPTVSQADSATASELATIRNALRETELERSRLLQRQTFGVATVALLSAGLLGLAYAYKRRSATTLALSRDAAELRADRTRWQMLRYQLNPHFLFNALSSLSGLVVGDPPTARRVVDRLSEFCQLSLKGSTEELRPLGRELEIIRAYLDVEQAGVGDDLVTSIDVSAGAESWLVPPLILQPLVENALKYGGQTSPERLELKLAAAIDPTRDELVLEVANTGRWLVPSSAPRTRDAIGLVNVRQRLAQVGAPPDALAITHDNGWVRLTLRLPRVATPAAAVAP